MEYAESLRNVLVRKITRSEQNLVQLKLDYCRFIFGLSHRSQVELDGQRYRVMSVDVDSMERDDSGELGKPAVAGVPVDRRGPVAEADLVGLGKDWELVCEPSAAQG